MEPSVPEAQPVERTQSAVGALLALEIQRVLRDLEQRRELAVRVWSVHRERWPLAEAGFSRWRTLRHAQLDALSASDVVVLDDFYAALDAMQTYVSTTVDMPLHLDWNLRQHLVRLQVTGAHALEVLGPPPAVSTPAEDADGWSPLTGMSLEEPLPPLLRLSNPRPVEE